MYLIPTIPLSIGGINNTGVLFNPKNGSISISVSIKNGVSTEFSILTI